MTLLLGHIELHGLRRPDLAAGYYQLTLNCKPQDTMADLAKQGLQRSLVEPSAESLPSMLQDPFLNTAPPASTSGTGQSTAMAAAEPKPKPMGEQVPSPPPSLRAGGDCRSKATRQRAALTPAHARGKPQKRLVESFNHSKPNKGRLDQHRSSQAPITIKEAIAGLTEQLNDGGECAQLASPAQAQPLSPPLASPWWRQPQQK